MSALPWSLLPDNSSVGDRGQLLIGGVDTIELAERFGRRDVPLFTEACGVPSSPLPDIEEVIPDFATNAAAVEDHVRMTIDRIIELTPRLAERLRLLET